MNILITNDDGIKSYGMAVLAEELSKVGTVYIAAPATNQSGVGHGLTVTIPLRAKPVDFPGITGKAWAVFGTPADCVKLALEHLLPVKPDVVVSGINNGPNLGTDVIYSGTVAGAMEGFFHGIPAIAVSVASSLRHSDLGNYHPAGKLAGEFALKMAKGELPCTLLNINVPGDQPEEIKGVRFGSQGWRWYTSSYERRVDPQGHDYFWLAGAQEDGPGDGSADVEICAAGYASVTPLHYNMTDYRLLEQLRDLASE